MANRISRYAIFSTIFFTFFGCAKLFAQDLTTLSAATVRSARSQPTARASEDEPVATSVTSSAHQKSATVTTTPLTTRQKLKFGLRGAFFTPGAYLGPAIDAYFVERREVKAPGKTGSDNFADGASRFARSFTTRSSAEILGWGIYPIIFKQDPRYHVSSKRGFVQRVAYAASRTFVTRGDNGRSQPNLSEILGDLTSSALANTYERNVVRGRDRFGRPVLFERRIGAGPTFESFGITLGLDSLNYVVFDEFNVLGKVRKIFHK